MKTIKLKAAYDYDFYLLGIIAKVKEYTLSWAINRSLGIELIKDEDLNIHLRTDKELQASLYSYESDPLNVYLIKNKLEVEIEGEPITFAPSLNTFDYLLKVESENGDTAINSIYDSIRSIGQIQSVLKLDVSKIKEKEYFLL